MQKVRRNINATTDIYAILSEEHSQGRSNLQVLQELIEAGVKIVQYREKDKSLKEQLEQCRQLRELTRQAGVTFIINDHVDLALLVEADGVHIGQDDLPVAEVRKLLGPDKLIGLSTHSPEQAQAALAAGVDYIGVGPLFTTSTKKDVCAAVGLEYLDYVVKHIPLPFVAIGGIKPDNLPQVVSRGATCVCLVTGIVGAPDIKGRVQELRHIMQTNNTQLPK